MIHYVKEKKKPVHFSHLQYYYNFYFHSVSMTFFYVVLVHSSYGISIYCLFYFCLSPEDQCNGLLGEVVICISVNDCHFNLKALLGIYDRKF